MKENSVGFPNRYLGADAKIMQMKSGIECCTMPSNLYACEAIVNVESGVSQRLHSLNHRFLNR